MELASDILVTLGILIVIGALAVIWWPLGLLALGMAMIALGFVFYVRAKKAATKGEGKANS